MSESSVKNATETSETKPNTYVYLPRIANVHVTGNCLVVIEAKVNGLSSRTYKVLLSESEAAKVAEAYRTVHGARLAWDRKHKKEVA